MNKLENTLYSALYELVSQLRDGKLTEPEIYSIFYDMMEAAGVDSQVVVNVLERSDFGDDGTEAAINIKVIEGN